MAKITAQVEANERKTYPAEEAGQVAEPARGHLLEDDGKVVRLPLLSRRLELHHERLSLGGEGQRPGRDHHRSAIVREGHPAQRGRRVLLLELMEDRAELGRRLRVRRWFGSVVVRVPVEGGGGTQFWF